VNIDQLFAPPAVLAAIEQLEALDARLAEVKDRLQVAKHSIKAARQRDADEGAAAELEGHPLKSSRAHEDAAEAAVAELTSRRRAVEAAWQTARDAAYEATVAARQEWLDNVEAPEAEAREKLSDALATAKSALGTMAQAHGVRTFLADHGPADPGLSRSERHARELIARHGRYFPSAGRLEFPNKVVVSHNVAPSPIEFLEIIGRVLEDPKPPVVAAATEIERSLERKND